jgi:hypothetical protein
MVGLSGVEPLTSRLSGVRSSQLSYRPVQEYAGKKDKINLAARIPLVKVQLLDLTACFFPCGLCGLFGEEEQKRRDPQIAPLF